MSSLAYIMNDLSQLAYPTFFIFTCETSKELIVQKLIADGFYGDWSCLKHIGYRALQHAGYYF